MTKRERGSVNEGIGSSTNYTPMKTAAIEQWGEDWNEIEDGTIGQIKIVRQEGGINFSNLFLVSKTGVELADDLKLSEYWAFFDGVFGVIRQSQWIISDMTRGGEDKFGLSYKTIAERYDLKIETVRQYAYVSRNVSSRLDELSFSHHHEVVYLSPAQQKKWLNKALANNWGAKELRRQIQGKNLPATVSLLGDKENRNRMNRVWRIVQQGDFEKLKKQKNRDAVLALEAWIKEVKKKL